MRYAVYFCPATGSGLEAFGREWLSTTAVSGMEPAFLRALLVDVRRYGWHATLTAPFALADGVSYDDLRQKVIDVAQQTAPFELPLQLDRLAGFLALRPSGNETAIQSLAEQCVRALSPLRAPLSEAAWQRRASGLDSHGLALFRQFGYPYVLDRYRFHMTLSAPAKEAEERALCAWLTPKLSNLPAAHIDALTLCREPEPGKNFERLERIPLREGHAA
jgi:hypothetical protein